MARSKASSKASKENKKASTTNVGKNSKTRSATGTLTRKDTNTVDAPSTDDTAKKAANAPRHRATRRTTATLRPVLQPTDADVGEVGRDDAVANTDKNQTDLQPPATNTPEDLAATNAALKEQLQKSDARLEAVNATLMRLQAWEDAKPRPDTLIPAPNVKPYRLIEAMGLGGNRLLYNACRATVRETVKARFQAYKDDWRKQDPDFISSAQSLIEKRQPVLKNYERGWATLQMMRTYMKGRRGYGAVLDKLQRQHYATAEKLFGGINLSAAIRPVPVIPDSDAEDSNEAPRVKKAAVLKKKKTVVVVEDDEEEDEVIEKQGGKGRKRARVVLSSSEEEEEEEEEGEVAEKRKGKAGKRARVVELSSEEDGTSDTGSDDDSDQEQAPIKAKKTNGNQGKASKGKKAKKVSK